MTRNKHLVISFAIISCFIFIIYGFYKTDKPSGINSDPQLNTKVDPINSHGQILKSKITPQESTVLQTEKKPFKNQLASCYTDAQNITSLNDFFIYIQRQNSVKSIQNEIENIHFTDNSGKNLRAQLLYFSDKTEFKLYQVLSDDLPDPIIIPAEDSFNPDTTTLSKYINYNKISWQQKKSIYLFANQDKALIEFINSAPVSIDIYSKDFSISCNNQECLCKR
jgi:hypothetical protein